MSYLAEVAVLPKYRNTGLGTNLMLYAVLDAKIKGYKNMYMRTIGAGSGKSMSAGIAQKIGFNILPNIMENTLIYNNIDIDELIKRIELVQDQEFIRNKLKRQTREIINQNKFLFPKYRNYIIIVKDKCA